MPPELGRDVLVLDEPLPSTAHLEQIVRETFNAANLGEPERPLIDNAVDALIGLAAFPAEQALAISSLITGASSGIGRATAEAMAREGARVGVNYCKNQLGAKQAAETIRKAGGEALIIGADVTGNADVITMVEAVRKEWGLIDILVNNAGDLLARHTLADMTEEYWDVIMALNLKSAFFCVKAVWEEIVARKSGCIINVSSIAGRNGGGPGVAAYAAAKGGLLTYTNSLAKELAPDGVRVNGIAPGVIATPFHERYSPAEVMQRLVERIPLGRAGASEEIADVIVFLASPAARYITGETIEVNGGMMMD